MAKRYGLKLDKKKLETYDNNRKQYILNNIEDLNNRLEDEKQKLKNFKESI